MNKLLDKYFAKKVIQKILERYTFCYFIDRKIEKEKNGYALYIKHTDQKEECYKKVIRVKFKDWLEQYTNFVVNNNQSLRDYIAEILRR